MSEHRYISPMLDGFSLGQSISDHSGVECYPAMRDDSDKRYIVKKISLPASQVQVEALLLTGVYRDAKAVAAYYEERAQAVSKEVRILEDLAGQRGFVPYLDHQIVPMEDGVGYEVYLLSRYRKTLERHLRREPMTHLGAVNLGIDLCAAMAVSREAGWLYVDLKPENIHLFNDHEYRIGDLGFVAMDSLAYASLPDRYRSVYTAPEVADAYSSLNATMDTYALGLVLYQIYNQGKLPFADESERAAWLEKLASGESIVPPVCADEDMAAIITKACAYDPAERWQTPAELGHALISYMQRNGADEIPIVLNEEPEPEPETAPEAEQPAAEESVSPENEPDVTVEDVPEEISVEEPASAEAEINDEVEGPSESAPENADVVEEPDPEPTPADDTVEESTTKSYEDTIIMEESVEDSAAEAPEVEDAGEEAPAVDWIDLMDAFLAEEEPAETTDEPAAEPEPTLRELLGDEEFLSETVVATEEDVTAETADILSTVQELIEHEAPAPVIVPEPIDIPIPEPIAVEQPQEEPDEEQIAIERPGEDAGEIEETAVPEEEKAPGIWKKILSLIAALGVTAAIAFGVWFYYTNFYLQTIDSMTCDGTATQVTVNVDTDMDESQIQVICKDTYGNAVPGVLENGVVTFTDLVPGTQYIITLEPTGFNKLVGTTSATYSTPSETKVIHLTAVTGQEAGSAIISFGVEGAESPEWTLSWEAEGMEPQSVTFTGHTVTVNELTVGTDYNFTLTAAEDVLLVGETAISHTASDLVQAQNLGLADYSGDALTITWTAPEGITVERWIARCYNTDGYDTLVEVTEPRAVFTSITEGASYTIEVTAANMTLGVRTDITADANNITGFSAVLNGSAIELSWNYGGAIPEGGWKIAWTADGGAEQILTTEENKAVLSPAAPGSSYSFRILPPEGTSLAGASAVVETPEAGSFSANRLDSTTIIVEAFDVPSKSGWGYGALLRAKEQDTFKAGGSMALLYTVTKPYSFDSDAFETIFVIRDAEGRLISAASRTRSWDDMWDNGYCTETVTNLPAAAGSYSLSIYVGGGLLAQIPFTVK